MSPVIFNNLIVEETQVSNNFFKSEVFSLGMIILSMVNEDEDEI